MNSHEFAAKVAEDKAASFTLQRMIATAAERDVLDALIDAEALATFCKLRAKEAGIPMNTPMAETAGKECVRLQGVNAKLLAALQGVFEQCAMVHKHWGDGSNQREADAAQAQARAAIAEATT